MYETPAESEKAFYTPVWTNESLVQVLVSDITCDQHQSAIILRLKKKSLPHYSRIECISIHEVKPQTKNMQKLLLRS